MLLFIHVLVKFVDMGSNDGNEDDERDDVEADYLGHL